MRRPLRDPESSRARLDCGDKGVCYACSISCHADHELVELWPRREFTCDCTTIPASAGSSKTICTLNGRHRAVDPPNDGNRYMRNFRGEFCRCPSGLRYDPLNETEGMICCLACEVCLQCVAERCIDHSNRTGSTSLA